MEFIRHKLKSTSNAMAIGVGNCGGNVVNHLFASSENNISYLLINTDRQALKNSPLASENKILLGTEGLGARNVVQNGRQMALDSASLIRETIVNSDSRMVFVIAGMGGGTGSGAAPVIANIAKSAGILTVGVITVPFEFELRSKREQATYGVDSMIRAVDSLIVVDNSQISRQYGTVPLSNAYLKSNELLSNAVKGLSDIVDKHLIVNVGFTDVRELMLNSAVMLMGIGMSSGPDRVREAVDMALSSPALNVSGIQSAENILVKVASSSDRKFELSIGEFKNIRDYIKEKVHIKGDNDVICGAGHDDFLGSRIKITLFAIGFDSSDIPCLRNLHADVSSVPDIETVVDTSDVAALGGENKNDTVEAAEKIFHDFTNTIPAYMRRKVRLGISDSAEISSQKKSKRRKLVLELDESQKEDVKIPSLFDDF